MKFPTTPPAKAQLRRVMRGTEYFTLAFGSIVGVGWMVVLEQWFRRGGPAGAMLGFLLGGAALVPVVYVYGRLAERIPAAASEVAYTGVVFPRSVSFATGWAMTLTYVMVCPWETVAMCKIAAYSFPQMKTIELYQVGGYQVYLPYLLVGLGTVAAITFINYRGVLQSTAFQNMTTFGLLAIFCIFAPLGLTRGLRRVVQLYRRAGFAATWREIQRDLAEGPRPSITRLLRGHARSEGVPENFKDFAEQLAVGADRMRLKAWWIFRMYHGPDPLGERLTLLSHNHFANSNDKVNDLAAMHRQNEIFRKHAQPTISALLPPAVKTRTAVSRGLKRLDMNSRGVAAFEGIPV